MLKRRTSLFFVLALAVGCGDDSSGADAGPADAAGLSGPRPGKRSDVVGTVDSSRGVMVVFGGDNGPIVDQIPSPAFLSDTWVLESTGWSQAQGSGPSARGRSAVGLDPSGGRMLIFGGRFRASGTTGNYTYLADTWAFDLATRTWSELDDGQSGPAARSSAAGAYDPQAATFYVYGGDTNPSALGVTVATDVWAYASGSWSQLTTTGTAPSPSRLFIASTYDSQRNRLVVFGGQVGDFVTPAENDLYALDLGTMTWSQLHAGTGTAPSGRFSSSLTYDATSDRYLLFGGHADLGVTNDVWAFDPGSNQWAPVAAGDTFTGGPLGCLGNPREIPKGYVDQDLSAPERRSGGVFGMLDDGVWLFGGESDCSDHLDDTWRLDLASGTWTELLEAQSGESCARRNDDCQCLCL